MGVNGIYGLSGSGMDIDSLVKVGMMSKQNEYDKMAQKYTKNEWMKSDYLELSNSINTFNISTLSQYKQTTTMNAKNVESSSAAVKVSATSNTPIMSHTVEVKGLSANAYLVGTLNPTRYAVTSDQSSNTSTKLADILFSDLDKQVMNGQTYVSGHVATVSSTINGADTTSYGFGRVNTTYLEILDQNEADFNNANAYWQKKNANGEWETVDESTLPTDPGDAPTKPWNYNSNSSAAASYDSAYSTWSAQKAEWDDYQNALNGNGSNLRKVIEKPKTSNVSINDTAFSFKIGDGNNTATISYTYNQLLNGGKTLTDLASDINSKNLNVKASYDAVRDQFTLYNKESGSANSIEITIGADNRDSTQSRAAITARNFFDNLGLYQSANGELKGQNNTSAAAGDGNSLLFGLNNKSTYSGDDSEIIIDGVSRKIPGNQITLNGITYTALDTTKGTKATITVTQDTDAIIDKVKSFVADYNKLLSSLYEKYDEKPNSDYKPLTQSQKDSMKEEQITKWEEKAKKGMLYHDQTIGKIIQNMRSAITKEVDLGNGDSISVFSIGISTTGLKGQLKLDEDKLKKALAEDPDSVYNVFAKLDSEHLDDADKSGVAQRLGDVFTQATKSIRSRAGSTADTTEDSDLNNLLRSLQTRMSNFKKMMSTFENALYKKYDAMESTLARLGTQLSFIMGGNS